MRELRPSFVFPALLLVSLVAAAQQPALSPTPPMGWNSWDSYGLTITEEQFRANVEVEATRLKDSGYAYAVVDEGWYLANPEAAEKHPEMLKYRIDANGLYQPSLNRFASADGAAGFAPLADFVHAKGLKFGIHIIRGISKQALAANLPVAGSSFHAQDLADTTDKCPWNPDNFGVRNNAAGQAWYDSMLAQYAAWGIDYIKVDCIASHPYKADEIRMIHQAIAKTGRPIVLSLSPGPASLDDSAALGTNAQLWRISDDVWDRWYRPKEEHFPQGVKNQFEVIDGWTKYVKPGNWPDADMLPLGHLGPVPGWGDPRDTRLTHDEQRTLMTLWSISRSALFFGGNLTQLDDWTASLLTNPEVIAMDQHGHDQHQVSAKGDIVAWTSIGDGGVYLAVFNLSDAPVTIKSPFSEYGLPKGKMKVRDVWAKADLPASDTVATTVAPHGSLLLAIRP